MSILNRRQVHDIRAYINLALDAGGQFHVPATLPPLIN